jgi:hypothetical protein
MTTKAELDNLIEAALADNKLTTKEMEVLIRKAKQLGIDEDEFLIELDAKKLIKKKAKIKRWLSILNNNIYHREAGYVRELDKENEDWKSMLGITKQKYVDVYKKALTIKVWHIVLPCIIVFLAIFIPIVATPNYSKKIDKALVEYNIAKAYEINAKYQSRYAHQKILKVAVPYYVKEGNLIEALSLVGEYGFNNDFPIRRNLTGVDKLIGDNGEFEADMKFYNSEVEIYNDLLLTIANSSVSTGNNQLASDIIETKLKPFVDADGKQTFIPIEEKLTFLRQKINGNQK